MSSADLSEAVPIVRLENFGEEEALEEVLEVVLTFSPEEEVIDQALKEIEADSRDQAEEAQAVLVALASIKIETSCLLEDNTTTKVEVVSNSQDHSEAAAASEVEISLREENAACTEEEAEIEAVTSTKPIEEWVEDSLVATPLPISFKPPPGAEASLPTTER